MKLDLYHRLNHPNIIRYFNSWIEYDIYKFEDNDTDSSSDSLNLKSGNEINDLKLTKANSNGMNE